MFELFDRAISSVEENCRFELRMVSRDRDEFDHVQARHSDYFPTAVANGIQLYRQVYRPDEPLLMLYRRFATRQHKIQGGWLEDMLGAGLGQPVFRSFRQAAERPDDWTHEAIIQCRPTIEQVSVVFDRVVRKDFVGEERGSYYFVSPASGIVLHLYDDRGAVVAGPRKALPGDWAAMAPRLIAKFSGPDWFQYKLRPH